MTLRRKILKLAYPALMKVSYAKNKNEAIKLNDQMKQPTIPFYSLQAKLIDGKEIFFSDLKGKKILIVNTASDCGYTDQYSELETLYKKHKDKLIIIGFPSNDFKEQEKGSNEEIVAFCKKNYGVTFLLMEKSGVLKNQHQNSVFNWLSDASKNGWNDKAPEWNFSKYLVDENGLLTHYFSPSVSPLSSEILDTIDAAS